MSRVPREAGLSGPRHAHRSGGPRGGPAWREGAAATRPCAGTHSLSLSAAIEEPSDLVDLIKMLGRSSHGALAMAVYRKFVQRRDHPYPDMRVYDATGARTCA